MHRRPISHLLVALTVALAASYFVHYSWNVDLTAALLYLRTGLYLAIAATIAYGMCGFVAPRTGAEFRTILVDGDRTSISSPIWLFVGFALVIAALCFLELRSPMYFTKDDNSIQFLPMLLYAGRALLQAKFPEWNPYQLMGAPSASMGIYAQTYPPSYLAYLIARFILKNEFLTLEVFVILHLIAGFLAMYWAARCYRVRSSIASLAGLCAALSGFALTVARNWYYMSPVFVYVPLAMGLVAQLSTGKHARKNVCFLGLCLGVFFHAGNAQMWTYSFCFAFLVVAIAVITRMLPISRLSLALCGVSLALAVAMPLLYVQRRNTREVYRPMLWSTGYVLPKSALAIFLPGPAIGIEQATDWGDAIDPSHGAELLFSGGVFALASLAFVLGLLFQVDRRVIWDNVWIICGIAALLCSMGVDGVLWPSLARLPVLSDFRVPFKFMAFVVLFSTIGGALVVERVLTRLKRPRPVEMGLVAITITMMVFHLILSTSCFYEYHLAYSVPSSVSAYLSNGENVMRFLPIGPFRSPKADYGTGLLHDLPSVAKVYSADGLDGLTDWTPWNLRVKQLIDAKPDEALEQYGIQFAIVDEAPGDNLDHFDGSSLEKTLSVPKRVLSSVRKRGVCVYRSGNIEVLKLERARPMAFAGDNGPLAVTFDYSGATVVTAGLQAGSVVTVNTIWRPGLSAEVDRQKIATQPDFWGRTAVRLPKSVQMINLRYRPGWGAGFIAVLPLLGLAWLASWIDGRLQVRTAAQAKRRHEDGRTVRGYATFAPSDASTSA